MLSKDLMAKLYDSAIWRWEKRWKDGDQKFRIDAKCFKEFRGQIKLHLESLENVKEFEARMQSSFPSCSNWIVFVDSKRSQVKSILSHLRNAAAHAHIEKPHRNFLEFKSELNGKRVMQGRIEVKHFQSFMNVLAETAK